MELSFTARIVRGSGRGKGMGTPTLNLAVKDVPPALAEGIHACFARVGNAWRPAVLHFGPRPVFNDTPSCEVHLIDGDPPPPLTSVTVALIGTLRPVRDFPSPEALMRQIRQDVEDARAMLAKHGLPATQSADS